MNKYKPEYLGKVLPEDKIEISDFMQNKYDGFSKIYDVCKCESEKINDIKSIKPDSSNSKSYATKIVADASALKNICDNNKDSSVKIDGDIISTE